MPLKKLIEKIERKDAVVGVIGLGYVGLPLALRFTRVGFRVIGFDIDPEKVKKLRKAESYIDHIKPNRISEALKNGFSPTSDFSRAIKTDALLICVPTPLDKYREPDLSYVINTMEALLPHLKKGQLISLESTTYPGTTDEELRPRIESKGFVIGKDFFLVHSPEREDPGNPHFTTETIPKICGGDTSSCLKAGLALYSQVINKVVPVSTTRTAELTKLLENIHRVVNIGLVNEMKIVSDKMGIDIHEVIRAAATKPFGFTPYYPGPGIGGHCIPVDPFYLTWKAREYGIHTRFIELAGEVNTLMPHWVISKLMDALNERKKSLRGSRVLVLGIAYKKNVDDVRESPSLELMEILKEKKANIDYCDPFFPTFPKMRRHKFNLKSVPFTKRNIASYDCVLIATQHDAFDYKLLKKTAQLIIDTRGVYQETAPNIVKA
ncbi:MAG: UDP-N-acetyl-D-glucosamine 6-dehydrogenase [Elusimicrobia bacterium]|nr:UDP-N-acetyl-D-glucosamine 6-dehydrogenase [Elusimicrobiota bacterium]